MVTEVGRQPWIVYGLMRVADAVNPVDPLNIWIMLSALLVAYVVIAYFFISGLFRLSARWRLDDEGRGAVDEPLPEDTAPYGPRMV